MPSTTAEEVSTHAVSPVSILGGGAGAAAGGVPPGAGALVAGGAAVVICAITPFAATPRIIHATMPDTISRLTITRCRKIVFMSISDRKSTRLNSSHITISYAVFYFKKKTCGIFSLSQSPILYLHNLIDYCIMFFYEI